MTSGSPTSAMAPGSRLTPLAKGQEQEGVSCSASASTELLMPLDNDPGTRRKNNKRDGHGEAESEGVHPALGIAGPFQTAERGS